MNPNNEQCPRCKSYKLTKVGKGSLFMIMLLVASALFWVGIFIWPLLILSILLVIASPIAFFINTSVTCGGCGYKWEIDRKTKRVILK